VAIPDDQQRSTILDDQLEKGYYELSCELSYEVYYEGVLRIVQKENIYNGC